MIKTENLTYWDAPVFAWSNMNKAHNIIKIVSEQMNVSVEAMKSERRFTHIVEARQLCYFFIRKYTTLTLERTASIFNRNNHTTVLSGIERISDMINTEKKFKEIAFNIDALCENMAYAFEEPQPNKG